MVENRTLAEMIREEVRDKGKEHCSLVMDDLEELKKISNRDLMKSEATIKDLEKIERDNKRINQAYNILDQSLGILEREVDGLAKKN